ncbi:hypothetical protein [Streptomyces sp. NPDC045470]|uniref:hypothetical protein n=1 Tax=unclassified Streptomyces TaxID=2593676 RepID=UPI0033D93570
MALASGFRPGAQGLALSSTIPFRCLDVRLDAQPLRFSPRGAFFLLLLDAGQLASFRDFRLLSLTSQARGVLARLAFRLTLVLLPHGASRFQSLLTFGCFGSLPLFLRAPLTGGTVDGTSVFPPHARVVSR